MSLSETVPTTAIDTMSEFTRRSANIQLSRPIVIVISKL